MEHDLDHEVAEQVPPEQGNTDAERSHADHGPHGYIHDKDAYLRRMRRIEGQARGLARMIEEDKYCIDILTQVSAVTKALESVALGLLTEHLNHCVLGAVQRGGAEAEEKMAEAQAAIARLVRS